MEEACRSQIDKAQLLMAQSAEQYNEARKAAEKQWREALEGKPIDLDGLVQSPDQMSVEDQAEVYRQIQYATEKIKQQRKSAEQREEDERPECIVKSTVDERGKVYGEPHHSHKNIGLAWTGLIQQHYGIVLDHPLPHWLVEQMMVQFKVHRSARVFHADNYIDANAYLRFAEHGQQHPTEPFIND